MSSHARSSREEERRLSLRTLVFASVGSATAAIVTSQFWTAGTPIAAAMTPVIVALVSEMLHRPTERIAQRLTTETSVLRETDALPEAAGAGPPPKEEERRPRPAREAPGAPGPRAEPEFRVYRSGGAGSAGARNLPWKLILSTAAIAFAIAVAVLTLPELVTGESLFGGDRDTTVFGGRQHKKDKKEESQPPVDQETGEQTTTQPAEAEPEPEPAESAPQSTLEEGTPTTPGNTTTTPLQPRSSPPPVAPVP